VHARLHSAYPNPYLLLHAHSIAVQAAEARITTFSSARKSRKETRPRKLRSGVTSCAAPIPRAVTPGGVGQRTQRGVRSGAMGPDSAKLGYTSRAMGRERTVTLHNAGAEALCPATASLLSLAPVQFLLGIDGATFQKRDMCDTVWENSEVAVQYCKLKCLTDVVFSHR
jgi:hypothetical protein